jgi:dipeptidyl aminopeptidase/acylaminoacyl peptidase
LTSQSFLSSQYRTSSASHNDGSREEIHPGGLFQPLIYVAITNFMDTQVLISAPRRTAAVPNPAGTLALFTVSTYSFETHSKTSEIRVLDLKTGQSKVLTKDVNASEPTWLGKDNLLVWLRGGEKGTTNLVIADVDNLESTPEVVTSFNGSLSNPKVVPLDSNTFALALTGLATPDGDLYNPETAKKPLSTGKVYSSLFVRQWDAYVTENKSTIWYTTLKVHQGVRMYTAPLTNALKGHSLQLESPVPPFGGAGDFNISKNGIVFVAKDPKLDPANHTKTDTYFIPLKTFTERQAPSPQIIKTGNLKGYSQSPVFSPDAKSVVFTRMKSDQYESDKSRLLLVPDITDLTNVQEFFETKDGEGKWDLRPEGVTFSKDGSELYVTAEENGRGKLFKLPASPRHATELPVAIVSDGTVTDTKLLPDGKLLISSNSLVDNSTYSIIDPSNPSGISTVSSVSKSGKAFGLSQDQVDEFWYEGAEDYNVHAWVLKPSNFDKSKKYPLAYLIHGGVSS